MNRNAWSYAVAAAVCAASMGLWPQAAASQGGAPAAAAAPRFTVIGCISRDAASSRFFITDMRGTKTVFRIDGDQATLEPFVGQFAEITGPVSAPAGGAGPNASAPIIKMDVFKRISRTCPTMK
jgi:hypothetical protein